MLEKGYSFSVAGLYVKGKISKTQHGFVPKKSTATNLLESLSDWTSNFDKQISTYT